MALARPLDGWAAGFVHTSSMNGIASFDPRGLRSRHLIVLHTQDACRAHQPLHGAASHRKYGTELIEMSGGTSTGTTARPSPTMATTASSSRPSTGSRPGSPSPRGDVKQARVAWGTDETPRDREAAGTLAGPGGNVGAAAVQPGICLGRDRPRVHNRHRRRTVSRRDPGFLRTPQAVEILAPFGREPDRDKHTRRSARQRPQSHALRSCCPTTAPLPASCRSTSCPNARRVRRQASRRRQQPVQGGLSSLRHRRRLAAARQGFRVLAGLVDRRQDGARSGRPRLVRKGSPAT